VQASAGDPSFSKHAEADRLYTELEGAVYDGKRSSHPRCPMKRFLFATVLTFPLVSVNLHAEDSTRGRLPDGRAFRTDPQGNQLVDYIAELELSVDTLKQQVHALENDITAKNELIEKLDPSGAPAANERKLHAANATPDCTAVTERTSREKAQCVSRATELSARVEALSKELARTEDEARETEVRLTRSLRADQQALEESHRRSREELQKQVRDQTREAASLRAQLVAAEERREELDRSINDLRASHVQQLRARDVEIEKRDAMVLKLQDQLRTAQSGLRHINGNRAPATSQMASLRMDQFGREPGRVLPGRPSIVGERAVDSVKGRALQSIASVKKMVEERDALFQRVNSTSGAVKFKPTPPRTTHNETLDTLANRISSARTMREISLASRDIEGIRVKIEDDIALGRRFVR
jgi:predicted  nucleic acid-binding Zn-ribbon protein